MDISGFAITTEDVAGGALGGALVGFFFLALFIAFLMIVGVYVYISYVYMLIARKGDYENPGIAWIPFVGPSLISAKLARMDWWPTLLLIGILIPGIGTIAIIAWGVFLIIWTWKMFEGFGRPGWWAIFWLINIVELVFLGIIAWSDDKYNSKKIPINKKDSEKKPAKKSSKKSSKVSKKNK